MFITTALRPRHSLKLTEILEDHYLEYAQLQGKSPQKYRCELRRWVKHVGDIPIHRIDTEHFVSFRRSSTLATSSTEGSIKIVKILLRFARDRGWIKSLPLFGKSLVIDDPDPDPATLEELSKLYIAAHVAQGIGRGLVSPAQAMRSFIVLEYFTGIRGQDLCWRLGWRHVQADHIRFRQSKTARQRRRHLFPLHPLVVSHLADVHGMSESLVFGIRSLQKVNDELAKMCQAAGIRKLTTGNIRQACFTSWAIAGETAGKLVHGCGLPQVLRAHYLGRLQILQEALPRFRWFDMPERRQLTLF